MGFMQIDNAVFDALIERNTGSVELLVYMWLCRHKQFGAERVVNGVRINLDEVFITVQMLEGELNGKASTKQVRNALDYLEKCGFISCRKVFNGDSKVPVGTVVKIAKGQRKIVEIPTFVEGEGQRREGEGQREGQRQTVEISTITEGEGQRKGQVYNNTDKDNVKEVVESSMSNSRIDKSLSSALIARGVNSNFMLTEKEYATFKGMLSQTGYNADSFIDHMSSKMASASGLRYAQLQRFWTNEGNKERFRMATSAIPNTSDKPVAVIDTKVLSEYGYSESKWAECKASVMGFDWGDFRQAVRHAISEVEPRFKSGELALNVGYLAEAAIAQGYTNGDIDGSVVFSFFGKPSSMARAISINSLCKKAENRPNDGGL